MKLFSRYLDNNGYAILNSKISITNDFKKKLKKKNISLVTFGNPNSTVYIKRLSNKYLLKINKKKYNTIVNLTNHYDLNNIGCAVAIALCLGLKQDFIVKNFKKKLHVHQEEWKNVILCLIKLEYLLILHIHQTR